MSTCEQTGCPGHLAKFDSCRDEALYELTLDSGQDEETGDSDFQGWHALFILPDTEPVAVGPDGVTRLVTVPAGNYILTGASSGKVTVGTYATEAEARAVFEAEVTAYEEWCATDDE